MARSLYRPRVSEALDKSEVYYEDALEALKTLQEDRTITDFSAKVTAVIEKQLKRFMAKRKYSQATDVQNFADALATACTTKLSESPTPASLVATAALLVSYNLKTAQKQADAAESAPAEAPAVE
jgi:glutamyl-tRNA reductase